MEIFTQNAITLKKIILFPLDLKLNLITDYN